jgi:hypothetical protein
MDRCDRVGGLALEVARSLTLWREAFPDAELERLLALM